jgi:hypothetical protein
MSKIEADTLLGLIETGRRLLWDLEASAPWLATFLLRELFDHLDQAVVDAREEGEKR